jgi:glycosyltransferase involved in cell wall biosynthesis
VLLYLSRIHPKKGLDLLLASLRLVPEEARVGWRLAVIGGGDRAYLRRLRRFADRYAAELPPIEWKGEIWSDKKWDYLQGADLFCLPTHSENFGFAVMEAMQVGTPILTTDQTPWGDERGKPGFFIARPTVSSLREQLLAWREAAPWSERDRAALAGEARARFHGESLSRDHIAAYEFLIAKGGG